MRRLAHLLAGIALALLPRGLADWGRALRAELSAIDDPRQALRFALGGVRFGLAAALHAHLLTPLARPLVALAARTQRIDQMTITRQPSPVGLGVIAGTAATMLGLLHMGLTGAPGRLIGMNAGALAIGLALCFAVARHRPGGIAGIVGGSLLVATALFGPEVAGAARWLTVGGITIQPSLILLPAMLVAYARRPDPAGAVGLALAAVALALQPDRAMAGMLAAGLLALALVRHDRLTVATLAASGAALLVTLLRPDRQGAMPFVDQILWTAFAGHPVAGAAVWLGSMLMLLPALAMRRDPAAAVFGAAWLAAIVAAALGNYPTPLVGYGGSAILGYLLAVGTLPGKAWAAGAGRAAGRDSSARPDEQDSARSALPA